MQVLLAFMLSWPALALAASPLENLSIARDQWRAHRPASYDFVVTMKLPITVSGKDAAIFGPLRVSVRHGQRTGVTVARLTGTSSHESPAPRSILKYVPRTIDDLFEPIASSLMDASRAVTVEYDAGYGFPCYIEDLGIGVFDTDSTVSIRDFKVVK
jgi:hypothetical protein